jgi:hypothetical protein
VAEGTNFSVRTVSFLITRLRASLSPADAQAASMVKAIARGRFV